MEQRSDNLTATNSTSSSDRRSNLLAAMLCICALMYVAAWLRILPDRETHTDFSQFYVSALLMRNHQDTYNTDIHAIGAAFGLDTANIEQANYPPTFLMMFEPLTLVRPRSAFWIWTFVNVVALAISLWMLLRPAAKYGTRIVVSMLALSLIYPPVTNHFYYSQSKILLLLMLTAMMLALERRHDLIAGVLLALGTLWLMFPIALFGYLILSRRWRAVGWGVGGIIALAGLTILVVGARNTVSWRNGIGVLTDSAWYSQSTNVAIGSFVSRTFWDAFGPMLGPRLDRVRRVSSACAQIAILVLACIPLLKNPRRGDPDARVFCLWIVACVLASPTAWIYNMVLLLIPFSRIALASGAGAVRPAAIRFAKLSYATIFLVCPTGCVHYVGSFFYPLAMRTGLPIFGIASEGAVISLMLAFIAVYLFALDPGVREAALPGSIRYGGPGTAAIR
jgi:hypothetical protein